MKKYILILGTIYEADPLIENFTTLIISVEGVIESNDIYELELYGSDYLSSGGTSYKVLVAGEDEHSELVWSNKAHNQYNQIKSIEDLMKDINPN